MLIDNYSGYNIDYKPCNIKIKPFKPNMTLFVQPLDAGIMQAFKAHYRQAYCLWVIEKDDAGEQEIYKIKLLEGMLMAKAAWEAVKPSTIANC